MELNIYTVKDEYIFKGKEAENVMDEIKRASSGNAEWTTPIILKSGKRIIFVLSNIVAIEFK